MSVIDDPIYLQDSWILDLAFFYCFCPDTDLLASYKACNVGSVFMGNNSTCKIVGVGTIRIKMYDGVVRTLIGVRHNPNLKKNLISLGTLQ